MVQFVSSILRGVYFIDGLTVLGLLPFLRKLLGTGGVGFVGYLLSVSLILVDLSILTVDLRHYQPIDILVVFI